MLIVASLVRSAHHNSVQEAPLPKLLNGIETNQDSQESILRYFLPLKSGALARNIFDIVAAEAPIERPEISVSKLLIYAEHPDRLPPRSVVNRFRKVFDGVFSLICVDVLWIATSVRVCDMMFHFRLRRISFLLLHFI